MSPEEFGILMSDCLVERGWDAEPDPAGGVAAEYQTTETSAFEADYLVCQDEIGFGDPVILSERQWAALYADYSHAIECLQENGVDVPDPVDEYSFRADGLGTHFAYQYLPESDIDRLSNLEAVCPQPEVQY